MDRKSVVVVIVLVLVAAGFLVVRDPIGAAGAVRSGWSMLAGATATLADAMTTFFDHLLK